MIHAARAFEQPARSDAHGLRSHRSRLLLMLHKFCRIGVNSLNAEDARIILLRDLQDVPYEEVAAMLEIPVGTVKSRLHRARQALRNSLAPYFQANRKAS